jgi:glycosyltransferase involved in cell wall biosynthesis
LTYAVVTPARDEARNLPRLAECLAAQRLLPSAWVIVENGSTDDTLEAARTLAARHPWIQVLSLQGQTVPTRGGPIARAFEAGVEALGSEPSVVVIVDGDVTLGPEYFERLMEKFAANPRLGMASGNRYEFERGEWRRHNPTGSTTVEGQCRAYRWASLPDVLPLDDAMSWDGIDAIKATLRGWETRTFFDFGYRHHRAIGTRDGTRAKAWATEGRGAYYMGYRPYYIVLRALHHARRQPSALGLVWGYASSAARRAPRCPDSEVIEYVRKDQSLRNILHRVREATAPE